jgi:hypothetical protein
MVRMFRTFFAISTVAWLAVLGDAAALAAPPVLPPLTPPPPSFETCRATGNGAICEGSVVFGPDSGPSGMICGTAANPVELIISGQDSWRVTRYYDSAGNLTREVIHEHAVGILTNPVTGRTATATQIAAIINTLAVPGDFATVTFQQTGVVKFYLPGGGVLLRDVGRDVIVLASGNDIASSGQHQLGAYFSGDHSVLEPLCAALGTPGAP